MRTHSCEFAAADMPLSLCHCRCVTAYAMRRARRCCHAAASVPLLMCGGVADRPFNMTGVHLETLRRIGSSATQIPADFKVPVCAPVCLVKFELCYAGCAMLSCAVLNHAETTIVHRVAVRCLVCLLCE